MMFPKKGQVGRYSRKKLVVAHIKDSCSEKTIQAAVEYLLNLHSIRYIHIPENLQRYLKIYAPIHIKKIASEALRGIPDIIAFSGERHLLLELKTTKGKLSQGQINWHRDCNVKVTYGMDEAINTVTKWIGEQNGT